MLLNAVILILQETLEAALLISVLCAICRMQEQKFTILGAGLLAGLLCAFIYAINLQTVSEWFDYVGQEVVNALLQSAITVLIAIFFWGMLRRQGSSELSVSGSRPLSMPGYMLAAAMIIMLAVTREGSEIVLYIGGLIQQVEHLQAVWMGTSLGLGIGISIGVLLYYGLLGLPRRWGQSVSFFLLALFAGNMLSQAVMLLTQADWIPSTRPVWDSSAWLPEQDLMGQLLYALVGYESTPSFWQVLAYVAGFVGVAAVVILARPSQDSVGAGPEAGSEARA